MMPTSAAIEQPRRRDRRGGFTLMEVVLALTIMGMLATLAVPFVRADLGTAALQARANEIANLMRRDRNLALFHNRRSAVIVDTEAKLVRSRLLDQSVAMPAGVTLRLTGDAGGSVVFEADGRASGARLILSNRHAAVAIDVNPLTAAIRVSEVAR